MKLVSCETDRPFALPPESIEIIIDLPMPTSVNRIWRAKRGRIHLSKEYVAWQDDCDKYLLKWRSDRRLAGLEPRPQITGAFEFCIYLARNNRGDGDNRIKAALDWLQSVEIIRNDGDCEAYHAYWVPTAEAPLGCRVHLRSLHT